MRAALLLPCIRLARAEARVTPDAAAAAAAAAAAMPSAPFLWPRGVTTCPIPTIAKTTTNTMQVHQARTGKWSEAGYRLPVPTCW